MKGLLLQHTDGKATPVSSPGLESALPTPTRLSSPADFAALAVIGVGLVAQFGAMRGRYLGPDEALHVSVAAGRDLIDVYLESRATAHPPLFFLLLHFWLRLGRSEFFLRLLPAIFGAAFLWFLYRWSVRVFGRTAGLFALLVAALSPVLLPLSAEVRGYSLLLFLSAAGLAEFEDAVDADSPARMAASFLLFSLAILTHYAALFIVLSLAVYAPLRLRNGRNSSKVLAVWAVAQAGAAVLYLFLYLTQVRTLQGSKQAVEAMTGWLGTGYFHPGQESVLPFLAHRWTEVFLYFFGSPWVAAVAFVMALTGGLLLVVRRRPAVFLLALPWFLGLAAGVLGRYPFGGTRHSLYLVPFVSAAIGVALSAVAAGRLWPALAVSVVSVPLLWATPAQAGSSVQMNAAMEQLRRRAPVESLLLVDSQTSAVLRYYLNRDGLGSYLVVRSPMWAPDSRTFGDEVERMIRVHRLSAGQRFWIIRVSSDFDASRELARRFSSAASLSVSRFGDISILEVQL